jgi:hypothetical protein
MIAARRRSLRAPRKAMLPALALSLAHNKPLTDLFALDLVSYARDSRRQSGVGFGA